ncbi:MAG TPA: hypothetical protein EYQ38_00995 [Candidatus Pelagibacter sp.]|jgi:nucleoside-diphosphate-sugar epimerase|nr:hypothetical protein [Candidatus Pelagibacter sp.]
MKILLTGASSDTGLKIAKKIIENSNNFDQLILLSSSSSLSEKVDINKNEKVKIIHQNLLDPFQDKLKLILKDIDILIHAAWIRPNNSLNAIDYNCKVAQNFLDNINKKTKIIFLSSISGYPKSLSYYGKSKFKVSEIFYNNRETCVFVCGLIITNKEKTSFYMLKKIFEKLPFLIKFGGKTKVLFINSDKVLKEIYNKIFDFKKGVHRLYENEDTSIDLFAKKNFEIRQKISLNISLFLKLFLLISKYLNYIPGVNKVVDKIIILTTIDKLEADEFTKKGF